LIPTAEYRNKKSGLDNEYIIIQPDFFYSERLKQKTVQNIESLTCPGEKNVTDPKKNQSDFHRKKDSCKEKKVCHEENETLPHTVVASA